MKTIIAFASGCFAGCLVATFAFPLGKISTTPSNATVAAKHEIANQSENNKNDNQSVKITIKLDGRSRPIEVWCQPQTLGKYDQDNGLVIEYFWDLNTTMLKEYRQGKIFRGRSFGQTGGELEKFGLLQEATYELP